MCRVRIAQRIEQCAAPSLMCRRLSALLQARQVDRVDRGRTRRTSAKQAREQYVCPRPICFAVSGCPQAGR